MPKSAIRIIGGEWRSRNVHFPSHLDIKPTPNRVRETLFNWLAPQIEGCYCLDLFAGSGALGFEALSRGAGWVCFIEQDYKIAQALNQQVELFHANDRAKVYQQSYHHTHQAQLVTNIKEKNSIDLVFLDPPFRKGLLETSLYWLSQQAFLSNNACCYVEYEHSFHFSEEILAMWRPLKEKRAGQLKYGLWVRNSGYVN